MCILMDLVRQQVSWIRRTATDYHLLTVGLITYAGDDRYVTIHPFNSYVSTRYFVRMRLGIIYSKLTGTCSLLTAAVRLLSHPPPRTAVCWKPSYL
ncbi:Immunoglobulin V-set domain [Nesidiocoris tenuis]|uniref:Immunoglobulin V-set domain n=1 Tax=Nesidiocoris tenuis TaxID=355587 RepID=A0ABN7ADW1_9HEMI|nr:Immunoglobulin V-set domain [Nesidiocoris tenuis]